MDLTAEQYNAKFPTIKDLNKVWGALRYDPSTDNTVSASGSGFTSQATGGSETVSPRQKDDAWSQFDTVLLDDSSHKTYLQPYNHLLIPAWKYQKFNNLNVPTSNGPRAVESCLL